MRILPLARHDPALHSQRQFLALIAGRGCDPYYASAIRQFLLAGNTGSRVDRVAVKHRSVVADDDILQGFERA
jgi:hypothetical protein